MFKISLKLFTWKTRIQQNGMSALYVESYISGIGPKADRKQFNLNLEWPSDKIDFGKNELRQRFKNDPDVNDYNLIIRDHISKINEIAKRFRLQNRILSNEMVERELLYFDASRSLVAFMQLSRRERYASKEIVKRTYMNHLSTINSIIDFRPLTVFPEIDKKWFADYRNYLKSEVRENGRIVKKAIQDNTIWTRIKDVKAYLAIASEHHGIYVPEFGPKEIKNSYHKKEAVYLRKEEVIKLINKLDEDVLGAQDYQVLSAFLFCCFTAFRISDLYESTYQWMVSDNFLQFLMVKNSENKPKTITIPLIPIAKRFISNNRGKFFDLPTEQEYNRTLKVFMKECGINKKVTSHTARHTFGHLFMKFGGNILALNKILGHTKIETTMTYAHLDDDDNFDFALKVNDEFKDIFVLRNIS
ncbi:site-specific integrase [Sphingobacterium multivorum]|uniref:site-specific integrase n=1 Tax=Sphingobacterium multivorum TaxID=28454 RepID=UPI0031B9B140